MKARITYAKEVLLLVDCEWELDGVRSSSRTLSHVENCLVVRFIVEEADTKEQAYLLCESVKSALKMVDARQIVLSECEVWFSSFQRTESSMINRFVADIVQNVVQICRECINGSEIIHHSAPCRGQGLHFVYGADLVSEFP